MGFRDSLGFRFLNEFVLSLIFLKCIQCLPAHISIPHLCLDPLELELHVVMNRCMGGWEQNLDPLQQILFTEPFLVVLKRLV